MGDPPASFQRELVAYATGGREELKRIEPYRPHSERQGHRAPLAAAWQPHPPAPVAEAAARTEALTGIARKPTQGRQCLKARGMKPLKGGMIPATADVAAQETCKKKPGAALRRSAGGPPGGLFRGGGALGVCPVSGRTLGVQRLVVNAPSGRPRFHVVAAWPATSPALFTVPPLTSLTATTVWEVWQ